MRIDFILVKYCPRKADKTAFNRTLAVVEGVPDSRVVIRDNTHDNIGLVSARNELVAGGDSELLCFMDFDFAKLDVDWGALRDMAGRKGVGMVYPAMEGWERGPDEWSEPVKVPCNMLFMRREVFDGFDERYFVAYADWDFIMRLRKGGFQTLQHNHSVVSHIGLSSANPKKAAMWNKDRAVFRKKWRRKSL